MFGFSKKEKAPQSPVKDERRQWLEQTFAWLVSTFGETAIQSRKVLIPHHSDFPIRYNGDEQPAHDTLAIIARQMEFGPEEIGLTFYQEGHRKISTGSFLGTNEIYMEAGELSDSQYLGRTPDGKHQISLEARRLKQPEYMVSTLAHELARIKLLETNPPQEHSEQIADLVTIVFGLGIFNANAVSVTPGNLTQMDWGYALALFANLRTEKAPAWAAYLTTNIRSDFEKSTQYLARR